MLIGKQSFRDDGYLRVYLRSLFMFTTVEP